MLLAASAVALSLVVQGSFKPLDPELKNFRYPFPVLEHAVAFDSHKLTMAFMDVKPSKPNGETVVLLHGKNFSGNYWEQTARDLTEKGYRVIIPDQIGFGKSSKPEDFPYSFELLASLTHELVESRGVYQYIVVGHSMGGMLGTRLALQQPRAVTKLVLVNPIGLENYKELIPPASVEDLYEKELQADERSIRNYQRTVYFDGNWKPEYENLIEILVGWTKHKDYARIAKVAALTSQMIYEQPVESEFKDLKMPTLLLIGTRDRTAPGKDRVASVKQRELGRFDRLGKITTVKIPRSFLIEWPEAGHMPQIEVYDKYMLELERFLSYQPFDE